MAYFNPYENYPRNHYPITPSNTVDLPQESLVWCGSAGNVVALDDNGVSVTYPVLQGDVLPVMVSRVMATGTTATPLVGLR